MNPGVAQLVAHLTGGQGVVSSSLATRTKKLKAVRFWAFFVPKNKMLPREKVFYNRTAAKLQPNESIVKGRHFASLL